jgi:hypothetical protein
MEKEDVRFEFATDLLKRLELATPASAPGSNVAAPVSKGVNTPPAKASPPATSAGKPAKSGASGGGKRG